MTNNVKHIYFPSGDHVPALGQGTWNMGESDSAAAQEIKALQYGIDLGFSLIDTAEMYANGGSETIVGKAIQGRRDRVFLVSKVLPSNASMTGTIKACEASLRRMKTDYLDLYLLHWPGSIPLEETVNAMTSLVKQGKIRQWGVSNFDVDDLQKLLQLIEPKQLATNQILYNLSRRGIEFDLLPWHEQHHIPLMAYAPIEQGRLLKNEALIKLANQHNVQPAQIALAWVLRHSNIIAIPKASSIEHVKDNANALSIVLTDDDMAYLDQHFPPPKNKEPLAVL